MKTHRLLTLFIFVTIIAAAQPPQAIQYQAIARDNAGNALSNQSLSLRFTIHDAAPGGTILYREINNVTTNNAGSFSVSIGQGMVVSGVFVSINWASNSKFLEVEMDQSGGSNYISMGTQQLLSVPYALYSGSTGGNAGGDLSGTLPNPVVTRINGSPLGITSSASNGQVLKWNGISWAPGSDISSGGTVTSITAGTGLSGGTISTSGTISLPSVGTAGTYGSSTLIPVITTDAQGRVSNVSTQAVSAGWSLTGNNNTTDGTHFIGTTNGVALNFKVNNQPSGRIDYSNLNNTFFGYQNGSVISTGNNNSAFGFNALSSLTTGMENTALGRSAQQTNIAVQGNTAIGYQSQMNVNNSTSVTQGYNTSIGHNSLRGSFGLSSNTGNYNTAIGNSSMANNNAGSNNVAVGTNSLINNSSGQNNTSVGWVNMTANNDGSYNTAVGTTAFNSNVSGNYNTAIGAISQLRSLATGNAFNTSIGASSLLGSTTVANNTGVANTALGGATMLNNSAGNNNTAAGYQALAGNTTGNNNCGIGFNALLSNFSGSSNTAIGDQSGSAFNQGSNNTFVGSNTNATGSGFNNSTAIGNNTTISASDQVRIGSGVTSIGGPQDWSNLSDARIKTNVRSDVPGLPFIMLLKPVTYNKDFDREKSLSGVQNNFTLSEGNQYEKTRYTGFIAQDVEKSANEIGYEFSGVDIPKNENDLYSLRYATFVVPLVQAVQEQQALIEALQREVEELKKQMVVANKN